MTAPDLTQRAFDAAYVELEPYSTLHSIQEQRAVARLVVDSLTKEGAERVHLLGERITNPDRDEWIRTGDLQDTGYGHYSVSNAVAAAARILSEEGQR